MKPGVRHVLIVFAVFLLLAGPARAQTGSKLSARARIAVEQMKGGMDPRQVALNGAPVTPEGSLDVFIRGNVSRAELEAAGAVVRSELPDGLFTAYIPLSAIDAVQALAGVRHIAGAAQCQENLNASLPTTMADIQRTAGPAFTGADGAGVLIGDIDTGISYTHDDFKDAGGQTRIVRIWDQTDALGPNPSGYAYGSEWLPADINSAVSRERDTNGHGTHVMGIAAGDGSGTGGAIPAFTYVGMAPKADIVEIKSGLTDTQIIDGLAYFFNLATTQGKNAVMNMSFGSQFGPHDGTDDFESGISSLTGPGRLVTVSAGNDGGQTAPAVLHIHGSTNAIFPNPSTITLSTAGSASGRIIGIDGYYEATEAMNVTVTGPGTFGTFGPVTFGNVNAAYPGVDFGTGTTKGKLYIENGAFLTNTNAREVYFEIRGGSTGSAFNGTWTLTFTPTAAPGAANGRVDLWRYFVSSTAMTANFVTGLNDAGTVSEPGTATGVITCGAWVTKTSWTNCANLNISYSATTPPTAVGGIAPFSSAGPTRDGRMKPDIAAPGQGIGSARSLDITLGTCTTASTFFSYLNDNRMHMINQGTSMAAPHVAGAAALFMQKFGALSKAQLLAKLNALALVDGSTGVVPNNTWGGGKLRVDVTNPNVTVGSPNGGEILFTGNNYNLTWFANDPVWSGVTSVDIELSRDNGGSWAPIALAQPNSGTYPWTATGPITTLALLRVKAHDVADNVGQDVSNAVFTIANEPVATALALFLAENVDGGVKVSWKYVEAGDYVAAYVERANNTDGPWSRLGAPVVGVDGVLSVTDGAVVEGRTYQYRIQATGRQGETSQFGPISVTAGRAVANLDLAHVWPNPSSGLTRVDFSVPRETRLALKVFDIQGRTVATLADGDYAPGRYQVEWDGRAADGSFAANGIYFVHLISAGEKRVQRLTLSR